MKRLYSVFNVIGVSHYFLDDDHDDIASLIWNTLNDSLRKRSVAMVTCIVSDCQDVLAWGNVAKWLRSAPAVTDDLTQFRLSSASSKGHRAWLLLVVMSTTCFVTSFVRCNQQSVEQKTVREQLCKIVFETVFRYTFGNIYV